MSKLCSSPRALGKLNILPVTKSKVSKELGISSQMSLPFQRVLFVYIQGRGFHCNNNIRTLKNSEKTRKTTTKTHIANLDSFGNLKPINNEEM